MPDDTITGGRRRLRALLVCVVLVASGCAREAPPAGEAVVATVGETAIPASAFERSYALGFSHLKRGDDPRGAYLARMIDEKLLALEGRRLGLDTTAAVRRRAASLRAELLVEQVFEREVNDRAAATDEEIRAAAAEDAVRVRLRYLPAPTRAAGERLHASVRALGFDAARDRLLDAESGAGWRAEDFESPYLSLAELAPALAAAVAELPPGAVSAPVPYRGAYLVVQVADVRREGADATGAARPRYEDLVEQRKAKAAARRFVGETMRPLDLRLRGSTFTALGDALWAWYAEHEGRPVEALAPALAEDEGDAAGRLRALRDRVLFTTRDGARTVGDFLAAYPVDRYPLRATDRETFMGDLYDAVGLTLRDSVFVRRARAQGLDAAPAVREAFEPWMDHWTYRAYVAAVEDSVAAEMPGADAAARRARVRARLDRTLAALRAEHGVAVHRAVLDTLALDDPSGAAPDVLFFKAHTGRLAYPVVDPSW